MKPLFHKNDSRMHQSVRKFPIVDFNYHSIMFGHSGCCGREVRPAFYTLSRDYFNTEARRDFLAEAAVFGGIMAMAVFPILTGVHAMIDLVRVLGGI
jgi:hypothetical protein